VKIAIPEMLIRLRESMNDQRLGPRGERLIYRLWSRAMASPRAYRLLTRIATRTLPWFARDGWMRRLPGPLRGWTDSRDFPAPAPRRFRDLWRDGLSRATEHDDGR